MTKFPAHCPPADAAARSAPGDGPGQPSDAVGGEPEALCHLLPAQRLNQLLIDFNLTQARERIADFVHQSDLFLEQACLTILRFTPDRDPDFAQERAEATRMIQLLRRKDRT